MKLFIITGPHAVGKMSVGMTLAKRLNIRLFHNHMTIELVKDIYGYIDGYYSLCSACSDIRAKIKLK